MVEFKAKRQGIAGLFTLPYAEGALVASAFCHH